MGGGALHGNPTSISLHHPLTFQPETKPKTTTMNCRNTSTATLRRTWGLLRKGLLGAALVLFGTAAMAQKSTRGSSALSSPALVKENRLRPSTSTTVPTVAKADQLRPVVETNARAATANPLAEDPITLIDKEIAAAQAELSGLAPTADSPARDRLDLLLRQRERILNKH